jgi:hypothetical protein
VRTANFKQKNNNLDSEMKTNPDENEYGKVAVFEDLYGNRWDLLEPSEKNKGMIKE